MENLTKIQLVIVEWFKLRSNYLLEDRERLKFSWSRKGIGQSGYPPERIEAKPGSRISKISSPLGWERILLKLSYIFDPVKKRGHIFWLVRFVADSFFFHSIEPRRRAINPHSHPAQSAEYSAHTIGNTNGAIFYYYYGRRRRVKLQREFNASCK